MSHYELGIKEVLQKLNSNEKGLTIEEAKSRLSKYGRNQLERKHKISRLKIFLGQFADPIVIILIIATIISFFLKEVLDAVAIIAILLLNALLGFFQEYKAERSIELLQKLSVPKTKVYRDKKLMLIDSFLIVPGDIILFEAGDKVTTDCRIIDASNLSMDESILTGESTPVNKQTTTIGYKVAIADQKNMCFSGTTVASGRGKGLVVNTGMNTEVGKIAKLVSEVNITETPLQKKFKKLGEKLALGSIVIAVFVFIIGIIRHLEFFDIILTALSLAVAVVPEGLPAVVTISLALGVRRMLKRNALIRKLRAVETLGSTQIICSDKTGTLTKNEMTVVEIYFNNVIAKVSGKGYELQGNFLVKNKKINPKKLYHLLLACACCNNAVLPNIGDPTELALLVLAKKGNINKIEERTHEIPFDSVKKYMITTHKINNEEISFLKGAPEVILKFCNYIEINGKISRLNKKHILNIEKIHHRMTKDALRVLGVAYRKHGKTIFLGLTGMIDPPRTGIKKSIKLAEKAGIRTIMITGDHKNTAEAIAHEIGIMGGVIEGKNITKDNIKSLVNKYNIFARVDPEHKVMILEALQNKGYVVAMTGDGINDAPALKKADVGIAMSIKGTDVARDASDMVLVDDNYSSIVSAVREGRIIYDNIKKFVRYLLSANIGEIGVILFSLFLIKYEGNYILPLLPLQLLWMNLITDGVPALALGVDPPEGDVMKRKPRNKSESILRGTYGFILLSGLLSTLIVLGLFYYYLGSGEMKARTVALTTLIVFELFLAFSSRSDQSVFKLKNNKYLWLAVLTSIILHFIVLYTPLNIIFKLVPLEIFDWFLIVLVGSLGLIFFEVKKLIFCARA